jgi:hypothetical protein
VETILATEGGGGLYLSPIVDKKREHLLLNRNSGGIVASRAVRFNSHRLGVIPMVRFKGAVESSEGTIKP